MLSIWVCDLTGLSWTTCLALCTLWIPQPTSLVVLSSTSAQASLLRRGQLQNGPCLILQGLTVHGIGASFSSHAMSTRISGTSWKASRGRLCGAIADPLLAVMVKSFVAAFTLSSKTTAQSHKHSAMWSSARSVGW